MSLLNITAQILNENLLHVNYVDMRRNAVQSQQRKSKFITKQGWMNSGDVT